MHIIDGLALYAIVTGAFLYWLHCACVRSGNDEDPYRDVGQGGITKEMVDEHLAWKAAIMGEPHAAR
jgi:hypothetical protein